MLCLAFIQHNFDRIDKKKKVIGSIALVAMLVFTGFMGYLLNPKNIIPGPNIASASGTVGPCVNGTNPDGDWYNFTFYEYGTGGTEYANISTYGGSQRLNHSDWTESTDNWCALVFDVSDTDNEDDVVCWYSFWIYYEDISQDCEYDIRFSNTTHTVGTDRFAMTGVFDTPDDGSLLLRWHTGGAWTNNNYYLEYDTWIDWNISFNFSTHKYMVVANLTGGAGGGTSGWVNFVNTHECIDFIRWYGSGKQAHVYIDNISYYNGTTLFTEDFESSGGTYPTIDKTAFNASLTLVDSTYSITFSGNQSETVWCNNSGSANETMNVTIVDGNQSVTWVNITLDDIGTSPQIGSECFTLYAYNTSSAAWESQGTFGAGGDTISITSGLGATWPIDGGHTFLFRFKLVVPGDQTETIYTQITGCSVSIGG